MIILAQAFATNGSQMGVALFGDRGKQTCSVIEQKPGDISFWNETEFDTIREGMAHIHALVTVYKLDHVWVPE